MKVSGNIIDIFSRSIYPADVLVEGRIIKSISRTGGKYNNYIIPGLIDSHIHIESSMVIPGSFAKAAVSRGTVAVVSDPHEIANVLGTEGVMYMIENAKQVPLKFYFGAPSCVPATMFETSGAVIGSDEILKLIEMPEIKYLAEMMNYPGVIFEDPEVMRKIEAAKKFSKPVDGHAPGLRGVQLEKYVSAGISTDHECSTMDEALEKISLGMKILIREGSAARNLDDLKELYRSYPEMIMLCSDDLHPEMLARGHINDLVAKLVREGYDLFDVLRSCTLNPVIHYGLDAGLLREGDPADFIITEDPAEMNILETWIDGQKVYDRDRVLFNCSVSGKPNKFNCSPISERDINIVATGHAMRVIEAYDGTLFTSEAVVPVRKIREQVEPDISDDVLKIVVKDRYRDAAPSVAFIKGFGIKSGAFASSIAHDSHNIICVGTSDKDIVKAINSIIEMKGGLSVAEGNEVSTLKLEIAGIMSDEPVGKVAEKYEFLSYLVKSLGCNMKSPFMTLSFMALLVIPELKLSDTGLFNGVKFHHVPLFTE